MRLHLLRPCRTLIDKLNSRIKHKRRQRQLKSVPAHCTAHLALLLGPTFGLVRFSLLVIQWLISTYISLLGKINVNSALCGGKVNRRSATQLVKKHTTIFLSTSVCKIPEKRRKTPPWSCSPSPPAPRAPPPSGQGGH